MLDSDESSHPGSNATPHQFTNTTPSSSRCLRSYIYGKERVKNLPDQHQHLTTLRHLSIYFFDGLEALPMWLGNLSFVRSLELCWCHYLMNLPTMEAMQHLTNLQSLTIGDCPLLEERCATESGQEWHKIVHTPSIRIV